MTEPLRTKGANALYYGDRKHPQFGGGGGESKENRDFLKSQPQSTPSTLAATSLSSNPIELSVREHMS